jgi:tetratricopeptide (TPR) repeat protein
MEYRDFDLLIERSGQGYRAQVLESPAGQATADFTLPFSDLELENVLLRLGRPVRTVRRLESTEMSTAKSFGAALFNAVFSGDVRACLRSSVDEAKRESVGIRVRLRLADPALADLPWEFLYVQSVNRFLALSVQTPLVRYMDLPEVLQPIAVSPPIRVLAMISSPTDYPSLDVEGEWQRLNDALADLIKAGTLSLERMEEATLAALQRRLRRSKYHIFHFIGHGEFDQTLQEGVLLLEREKQRGHRVGSQYLGMLLHDHESLRVAVLNACEGARSSKQDPFAGSAQTLVQQGIPAVIAMQFEIADDVAQTFAHELYGALADSYPIDAAVTEARKAIFAMGREIEWATPVLYLRAPDGRIFDVDRSAATPATTTVAQPVAETAPGPSVIASQIEPLETMTPKEQSVALLRSAGRALGVGDYAGALDVLEQVRALDPSSPALADLTAMAQGQRAVAETRAQRRAEFREHLDAATSLLARNDLAAASARVTEALRLQPADPEARAVQGQIARKIEEGRLAAVAGRHGTGPERAGMAVGPATPPPHDPVTPGPAGDVHPMPDTQPPARMKAGAPRPAPANDESDLQES